MTNVQQDGKHNDLFNKSLAVEFSNLNIVSKMHIRISYTNDTHLVCINNHIKDSRL